MCMKQLCDDALLLLVCDRMESFPEACGRLLRELELQLRHRPLLMSADRLLQITAVNMFSVDNTLPTGYHDMIQYSEATRTCKVKENKCCKNFNKVAVTPRTWLGYGLVIFAFTYVT